MIRRGLSPIGWMLASWIFGNIQSVRFSWLGIVFAAGWTLLDTSTVLQTCRQDPHVAAELALFSCFAGLLLWVVRFLKQQGT